MAKDNSTAIAESSTVTPVLPERQTLGAMEAHERDKAERRKQFEKVRPVLTKCVDPENAARYERQKPRYVYEVTMLVMERDEKTKKIKPESYTASEIKAQNDDDAWALACDKVRRWPNRRTTEHKIVKSSPAT